MVPFCESLQDTGISFTSLGDYVIAPPVERDALPLQAEEHDDRRDRYPRRETRREDKVVLRPEPKVPVLKPDPAEPGDGDCRDHVA